MVSCAPYRSVIQSLYIASWTTCTWTHQVPLFLHHWAYRWGKRRLCPVLLIAFSRWSNVTWRCVSAPSLRWLTAGCCLHRHVCPLLTVPHRPLLFSSAGKKQFIYNSQRLLIGWLPVSWPKPGKRDFFLLGVWFFFSAVHVRSRWRLKPQRRPVSAVIQCIR